MTAKKTVITISVLLRLFSTSAMANFSGGDNFDDNSMDTSKWATYLHTGTTPFPLLEETNGYLEFTDAGGYTFTDGDTYKAIEWKLNKGSYTEDWSVSVSVTVENLGEALHDQAAMALVVYSGRLDKNSFLVEHARDVVEGHLVTAKAWGNGVLDIPWGAESATPSLETVDLRISFNSSTKTLTGSFTDAIGYHFIAKYNVSSWGMDDSDAFTCMLFADSFNNTTITAGQVHADNIQFSSGYNPSSFSTADSFSASSVDANTWINYLHNGTLPIPPLVQTNSHLEFTSPGVDEYYQALQWGTNEASYARDWSVTVSSTVKDLGAALQDQTALTLAVYHGSLDTNMFLVEHARDIYSGHIVTSKAVGNGNEDISWGSTFRAVTNDTVDLRISFDASTKTLTSYCLDENGSHVITNYNASSWGMDEPDNFTFLLIGGAFSNTAVASDQVYADNFLVLSGDVVPANDKALIYCGSAIVGSWIYGDSTSKDSVMVTFLMNGTYFLSHDSSKGFSGGLGMERGTYTWNTNTGAFMATVTADTNGEGGLSHPNGAVTVEVVGDILYYTPALEGTAVFKRVNHPTSPPSIVGGWYHLDESASNHDNVAITFLSNGMYFFAQDGNPSYDPSGQDGMERGGYSWDSGTGALSATALTDTCGDWGLDGSSGDLFVVNGNTLTVGGSFVLHRVVDSQCSDIDGDGLPDVWEQLYFSNPTNTAATGQSDGDTMDNRDEYVAGTDPSDGNSFFVITNSTPDPSGFVIDWPAVEGRLYSINWAGSLGDGFEHLATDLPYPQNSYTDTVHAAEGTGFYQVEVRLEN